MLNCIQTNGSKIVVKSLFDHSTIQQERNKLVIYDDDPGKQAAMKDAKTRYEEYLKWKEDLTKNEERKIKEYNNLIQRNYELKVLDSHRKKEEMRFILSLQVENKVR
jgi:hypothetical protein